MLKKKISEKCCGVEHIHHHIFIEDNIYLVHIRGCCELYGGYKFMSYTLEHDNYSYTVLTKKEDIQLLVSRMRERT